MSEARAEALASTIDLDPHKPLLIVDADEVLFHFMATFQDFIESRGHAFQFKSYALNGNVLDAPGGTASSKETVGALIQAFFGERTRTMPADPDAAPAIARLQADGVQAVVLSNVPSKAAGDRRHALEACAFKMALAPWSGPKGTAVAALAAKTRGPCAFVDDIAHHHVSVAEIAPDVHRLHYVTHPTLRRLLGPVEAAHEQADSWPNLESIIRARLLS
jgi:hypothetical protein